jgi:hypothetical protein
MTNAKNPGAGIPAFVIWPSAIGHWPLAFLAFVIRPLAFLAFVIPGIHYSPFVLWHFWHSSFSIWHLAFYIEH